VKEAGNGREAAYEALYFFDAGWASHLNDRVAVLRLASMLRWVSMNPRNLPRLTPKAHLSGLRRRLYCLNAEKTADKS